MLYFKMSFETSSQSVYVMSNGQCLSVPTRTPIHRGWGGTELHIAFVPFFILGLTSFRTKKKKRKERLEPQSIFHLCVFCQTRNSCYLTHHTIEVILMMQQLKLSVSFRNSQLWNFLFSTFLFVFLSYLTHFDKNVIRSLTNIASNTFLE